MTGFRSYRNKIRVILFIYDVTEYFILSLTNKVSVIKLNQEELDEFVASSSATLYPPSMPILRVLSSTGSIFILDNLFSESEALEVLNDAYQYHSKKNTLHNHIQV